MTLDLRSRWRGSAVCLRHRRRRRSRPQPVVPLQTRITKAPKKVVPTKRSRPGEGTVHEEHRVRVFSADWPKKPAAKWRMRIAESAKVNGSLPVAGAGERSLEQGSGTRPRQPGRLPGRAPLIQGASDRSRRSWRALLWRPMVARTRWASASFRVEHDQSLVGSSHKGRRQFAGHARLRELLHLPQDLLDAASPD